jgi:hypothetical protein
MAKIFIIIDSGSVTGVYSDTANVEVEIIDLDSADDEKENDMLEARAEQVMATYGEVG